MTKILFICKGNICRSPAAMYYLQQKRPTWTVDSMASTTSTRGQTVHRDMIGALDAQLIPCNSRRKTSYMGDNKGRIPEYDKVYDLHKDGIQDPYLTGDFEGALVDIIEYVDRILEGAEITILD